MYLRSVFAVDTQLPSAVFEEERTRGYVYDQLGRAAPLVPAYTASNYTDKAVLLLELAAVYNESATILLHVLQGKPGQVGARLP